MLESGMIVGNFDCCNCGEGTRGGLCVNCPLSFGVVMMLFRFWCGEFFFVDVCEDCVMNVDFNDNS